MASEQIPDVFGSAAHRNMVRHLAGPFQAGAVESELAISAAGVIEIPEAVREPLLLLAPAASLSDETLVVKATLDPGGAATALTPVTFAPYTEAGGFIVVYCPAVDPDTRKSPPFKVGLAVSRMDREGRALAAGGTPAALLVARLLEGTLGKTIFLLGAEKARIRRQGREIAAMRNLSLARWDALDRFGAGLAVPRFNDRIQYDANAREIVTALRQPGGKIQPEPDGEYVRRLQLFHPFRMPDRRRVLEMLNGPGADAQPNAGALGAMGFPHRFRIVEENNELAVAVHLVDFNLPGGRLNFLNYLRTHVLLWPANTLKADGIHAARFIASGQKEGVNQRRARLRAGFTFAPETSMAPQMAAALDVVARFRSALGLAGKIAINRAQDDNGGSRHELGLGVEIAPIAAAELDAMHAKLSAAARPAAPNDAAIHALLASVTSRPAAADPEGSWLFRACGLATVHRVGAAGIYLSHLPAFGLVINRAGAQGADGSISLEARYQAPGDPGANAVLVSALASAAAAWAAAGGEAWTAVSDNDARTLWSRNFAQPAAVQNLFQAAGLPAVPNLTAVGPLLDALPGELVKTIRPGPQLTQAIVDAQPGAAVTLRAMADEFLRQHMTSILPLVTAANEVIVVLGVIGLPAAGINLSERRATGFRWYVARIEGDPGEIKAAGSRTVWIPKGPCLAAVIALGYARRGLADPYEYRLELPANALLNIEAYEFLMNLLERAFPVGVEVNTFSIRREHVDLDGDGKADPLPPAISRTYRRFRRVRQRGEAGVNIGL